ncbi:hypothetical protein H310_03378 [Aphanomyces invadans]|uniref:Uncharacterized protein n=1 Tax=Aphanomyces invadans TaxID=157072 RepID=A0A024UH79_9STRA|nr:hypothetical protein H310_03378 [Aphanomyces invadans]ETW05654.1 hypothetical protein H310_03378 [Aphanomyces invadans]|eukprot:XP_008865431.1 hypothetical protein H310_03378 [Aphanomyces invadans]
MSRNQDGDSSSTTRLPNIYASPGNVGVQIDSYRTKDMFHRPRSTKFTTAFHGHMFQDHTLKNAKRMLARELQRRRDEEERGKKLAEYQIQRLEAKVQLEEKRKHREYLRKQRAWEMQQAMKAASQLALEHRSVVRIQSMHRGWRVRRAVRRQAHAATTIQATVRRHRTQQEYTRQRRAHRVLQNQCAVKIQAHVRRHLSTKRLAQMKASVQVACIPPSVNPNDSLSASPATNLINPTPPLPSDIPHTTSSADKQEEIRFPVAVAHAPTPPPAKPKLPSSNNFVLKRVGGGFRRIVQPPQLEIAPMPPSSARSPLSSVASTSTKKRFAMPQPPQRSFLQRWNEVPSPVAKSLESFIQDPNLAGKLKISFPTPPLSDADPPVLWRSRDAAELCAAMDAALHVAETFNITEEEMQPPLTQQDVVELTTAMDDMISLEDTVPECLDQGLPFVVPVFPITIMEKPPSRPEVPDPVRVIEPRAISQWLSTPTSSHDGEWTVLLDADFDAKADLINMPLAPPPDQDDDDHRIERCENISVLSSGGMEHADFDDSLATLEPILAGRRRPKSILKKSTKANPTAPVLAVGSSQFSLRKDSKRAHWVIDDACDDTLLGAPSLPPLSLT